MKGFSVPFSTKYTYKFVRRNKWVNFISKYFYKFILLIFYMIGGSGDPIAWSDCHRSSANWLQLKLKRKSGMNAKEITTSAPVGNNLSVHHTLMSHASNAAQRSSTPNLLPIWHIKLSMHLHLWYFWVGFYPPGLCRRRQRPILGSSRRRA